MENGLEADKHYEHNSLDTRLQPYDPYDWKALDTVKAPTGPPTTNPFKVGDKVKSTKAHDEHFGSDLEGIVDQVDKEYIEVSTRTGSTAILHSKWMIPFKGEFLFFHKGELV